MANHPARPDHAHPATAAGHGDATHSEPHLPHGSWWPLWVALGITVLGLAILFFGQAFRATAVELGDGEVHRDWSQLNPLAIVVLALALVVLLATLAGWFHQDYTWWKTNTGTGERVPKAGTLLFISSEIFLFGGLFSTFLAGRASALADGAGWPDVGHHFELLEQGSLLKLGFFSLFLFASSGTVHKAEAALLKGDHRTFVRFWGLTILLGAIFLAGQVWEYYNLVAEGHTLGSSRYITAFYMLTGTHGAHVLGGLVFLLIVFLRARKGQFNEHRHAAPQCAALYWHFVDIVWVVVLSVVYFWPALVG